MKTLIIYDSFFGNTEQIAQAIGQTLDAQTVKVNEVAAEQLTGIELLIVGSRLARPAMSGPHQRIPPFTLDRCFPQGSSG